ncbi:MAG: CsbD family protein [Candidatus Macondimonas sp.]
MNEDRIKGQWKQLTGRIKAQWGNLTDDDLTRLEGDRDYLIGKVQERYGISKEKAEEQIRAFENQIH